MADAAGVSIQTPETGPEAPAPVVAAPVVPDKFKNADGTVNTDALLASYAELEKKQGAPATKEGEQAPAAEGENKPEEKKEPPKSEVEENVTTVLKAAGLDLGEFTAEYGKDGKLSDDSYAKLEAKGFSKATVDQFIRGQEAANVDTNATAQAIITEVKAIAGGDEGYANMMAWAKDGLKPNEISEFNDAVSSGKPGIVKAAVQALKAQYEAAEGRDPTLIGGNARVTGDVFDSWEQVQEAMRDPRYGKDPAYTKGVEQKAMRSDVRKR